MTPQILTTNQYNQFKTITGNRNLNQKKINKIIKDISKGLNLLPYCPIIVYQEGEHLEIVDGQHRFEVSKQINSDVYYVLMNKLELRQIAMMNSRQDKWSVNDFLRAYVKVGIEDYQILGDVVKKYKVNISTAASFLMNGNLTNRQKADTAFRDGLFKVNFLESTTALFNLSHSLFDVYKFYTDRYLLVAVQTIQKKGLCDFKELKLCIDRAPMVMDKQATTKEYMNNIERVYNFKKKQRRIIF